MRAWTLQGHLLASLAHLNDWGGLSTPHLEVGTTQIAGGSGIQGLQRGTHSRPGMVIDSGDHLCVACDATTRHDRWTGNLTQAIPGSSMPRGFARRAVAVLEGRDVVGKTHGRATRS